MSEDHSNVFLVDAYSDPVVVLINGRASYLNAAPLGQFFERMVRAGKVHIVVDFAKCTGMDSTFLGILAGCGMNVAEKKGSLTLCRLNERNLELVRNVGLHRILTVEADPKALAFDGQGGEHHIKPLTTLDKHEIANARLILKAHENLVAADAGNLKKFQDVITALKQQI